jgi:hypothetical protein
MIDDPADRFSLVAGGPFHAALRRLRLIGADQLPTRPAAVGLALLAWLPPALLAIAQSVLDGRYSGWGFFIDSTVHTRYLIAIGTMLATERYADGRIVLTDRPSATAVTVMPVKCGSTLKRHWQNPKRFPRMWLRHKGAVLCRGSQLLWSLSVWRYWHLCISAKCRRLKCR